MKQLKETVNLILFDFFDFDIEGLVISNYIFKLIDDISIK